MSSPIYITSLVAHQAGSVAKIHQASQEGTFLTALGLPFLTVLYEQMSQSAYSLGFVALEQEKVVGFIVGTLDTKAIFKEIIIKRPFRLTWLVFKRALGKPIILWQAVQTLAYPAQNESGAAPQTELLALAVAPAWRNQGLGTQLIEHLLAEIRQREIAHMLVTVDGRNKGAQRFYARHGFTFDHQADMYGRPMVTMILNL